VFKHHGFPKDVVSDRDPEFTSKFWRALWKHMGSKLKTSTSFGPQTNGQIERVNSVIQRFLRNYVTVDQQDWVDHLELAEFCCNNSEHSTTRATPFQMVTSKSPIMPTTWVGQPPSDASEEVPMHNLMRKGNAYGKWPRLILRKRIKGTRTLRTSPDER